MDKNGNYTDRFGRHIEVGARVRVSTDYSGPQGSGVVESLPRAGSDYYGFPCVRLTGSGTPHIPDKALECEGPEPGSVVAHLESMIATTRAANDAKRAFLDSLPDGRA